ncbi:hypothetical protein CPB86DRAFT_178803 [Serendipita vermifera]|nr:hypothetical protein CPB86DRAFT_178803 [Serendipita vermifera]
MITNGPEVCWLTYRDKGRKPADLNSPLFGSTARPMGPGTRSAGNGKPDVTVAFGDSVISMIGQKCMYERLFTEDVSKRIARLEMDQTLPGGELNGLYLQGALSGHFTATTSTTEPSISIYWATRQTCKKCRSLLRAVRSTFKIPLGGKKSNDRHSRTSFRSIISMAVRVPLKKASPKSSQSWDTSR